MRSPCEDGGGSAVVYLIHPVGKRTSITLEGAAAKKAMEWAKARLEIFDLRPTRE